MVELGSLDECNHNIDAPCKRFQNISMKVITYLSAETDGKTTYENVCDLHLWLDNLQIHVIIRRQMEVVTLKTYNQVIPGK